MEVSFKDKIQKSKMVEFLKNNVARINTIKAESIVNVLADNSLELLLNDTKYLLDIKGISDKSIGKIQECLKVYVGLKELLQEIKDLDDVELLIDSIYKGIGGNAVDKIRGNPYCVCEFDVDFIIADKIALNLGLKADDKNRIKQSIMCVINNDIRRNGNLFSYRDIVNKNVLEFINKADTFDCGFDNIDSLFDSALNSLIIDGKIVLEEAYIYREDYYGIEKNIVERIKALLKMNGFCDDKDNVLRHEALIHYKLSAEQEEAISTALTSPITVITGGPGTGKTSIIMAMLSIIHTINANAEVKISAPTGKAAVKISKTTGREATTIHKLLNLSVGDSQKNKVNMINSDFLILDEASMIDAYLFCQLLTNTNLKTNIVIIGDYQQLPSVGPGAILKDLINSHKIPVVRLEKIHRQNRESKIVVNSHKLINMDIEQSKIEFDDKEFVFIETEEEMIIDKLIENLENLKDNNYELDDIMVLSTINEDSFSGVKEINRKIQSWYNEKNSDGTIKNQDRIIQVVNNYKNNVMNGEVGYINGVRKHDNGKIYTIKFEDKIVEYDDKNVEELQLAYAISIHKSQGSEYKVVLIPITNRNMYMANVNTLYTAITRSKERVVFIGDKQAFFEAINRRDDGKRNSRIVERLNT